MKFWERGVRASEKSSPISTFKIPISWTSQSLQRKARSQLLQATKVQQQRGTCSEVYGDCSLLEVIIACSCCLGGSTVKHLVEGLGSLLANRASPWENEPNAGEDKRGLANILYVFVTMSDFNDLLRIMTSASLLPSKFHAVLLLVNSNLIPYKEENFGKCSFQQ